MDTDCVLCEVKTEFLCTVYVEISLRGDPSLTFRRVVSDSIPALSMWGWWWSKWRWDKFCASSSVIPCQYHSSDSPYSSS